MELKWIFRLVIVLLFSCGKKGNSEVVSSAEKSELTFRLDSMVRESCVGGSCAKLRMVWPVAMGDSKASEINRTIQEQMAFFLQFEEEAQGTLDTLVAGYFDSFQEFKSEFPDSYGGWDIEVEGLVSYRSDNTVSIYFSQFSFLGGAHPNSLVVFLNFDAETGEYLSSDRLILNENKVFSLAEQKFREYHEVEAGKSLMNDDRFFLPETGFFLANATGFRDGKFWVVYVPYEIGPYVLGYTELEFTKEELGDAVRW